MTISRVHYFDRQFLRPQDMSDEQAYHLAMRRRHNIAAHIWGIVYGLEVKLDRAGNLSVQPGVAIDGYGRELVLPYPQSLDPRAFDQQGSERLEVWLKYTRQDSDPAQGGYGGCAPGVNPSTRSQETAVLVLRAPDPNLIADASLSLPERRQPLEVPAADLNFDPSRLPPDDVRREWPVYLGMLRRAAGQPPTISVDSGGRPYAGLVGELVRAPSGRAWMQVGAELKGDNYRFAVYLPEVSDPARPASPASLTDCAAGPFPMGILPRLGVTRDGEIHLRGDTTLEGDFTVDGGSIEFGVGPAVARPRPWRMYHVQGRENPNDKSSPSVHQLRIEMDTPSSGNPKGRNQVVIGHWSAKENRFKPCLTVDDRCAVTVHGNLTVEGILERKNPSAPSGLTPEAQASVTGMLFNSLSYRLMKLDEVESDILLRVRDASAAAEAAALEAGVGGAEAAAIVSGGDAARGPRLDTALRDVIHLMRENALLPRFMQLLSQQVDVGEMLPASMTPPVSGGAAAAGASAAAAESAPETPPAKAAARRSSAKRSAAKKPE